MADQTRKILFGAGAVLALGVSACSCGPAVPPGYVLYAPPSGGFSCAVPGDWRMRERYSGALATLYGPPSGQGPYSVSISVVHYPKTRYKGTRDLYHSDSASADSVSDLKTRLINGTSVYFFTMRTSPFPARWSGNKEIFSSPKDNISSAQDEGREAEYAFPSEDGLFVIEWIGPAIDPPGSRDVLNEMVETFRLRQ